MSARGRTAVFALGAAGLAAMFVWSFSGLPRFGDYRGPYGNVVNSVELKQRHATNVVATVVFDLRGFDTLGEELLLLCAVSAVALLLRRTGSKEVGRPLDPPDAETLRAVGVPAVALTLVLGLEIVAHGPLTPGGGFQGGLVLAGAALLIYLAGEYRTFSILAPKEPTDLAEGVATSSFVGFGLLALAAGYSFLENFLPHGKSGLLTSTGSIALLNWASGVAVAAAVVLLFAEYLEELMAERYGAAGE